MTSMQFSKWTKKRRIEENLSIKTLRLKALKIGLHKSYGWFSNLERTGKFAKTELEALSKIAAIFGYCLSLVPIRETLSEVEQREIHDQYKEEEEEYEEQRLENKNW